MGFDPISMGMKVVGGAINAFGAIQQGDSAAKAANYNANVAGFNSQQAIRNAGMESEAGSARAAMKSRETRADVGSEIAGAAGRGVSSNTGSAADVQASSTELGHLDAINIRSSAAKAAYGYQVQANDFSNEAALERYSGIVAKKESYVKAASSLMNSASDASSQYHQYKMNKGLGSSHPNTDYGIDE